MNYVCKFEKDKRIFIMELVIFYMLILYGCKMPTVEYKDGVIVDATSVDTAIETSTGGISVSAPTELRASGVTLTSVDLSWKSVSNAEGLLTIDGWPVGSYGGVSAGHEWNSYVLECNDQIENVKFSDKRTQPILQRQVFQLQQEGVLYMLQ